MAFEGFERLAKAVSMRLPQYAGMSGSFYCYTGNYSEQCNLYVGYTCDPAGISCIDSRYGCRVEITCAKIFNCFNTTYGCHCGRDFHCGLEVSCTGEFNCSQTDNDFDCTSFDCGEAWNQCDPIANYSCNPASAYDSTC